MQHKSIFLCLILLLNILTACDYHECIPSSNCTISWNENDIISYRLSCRYPIVGEIFRITLEKEGSANIGVILTLGEERIEIKDFPYTYTKTFLSEGKYPLSIEAGYYFESDLINIENTITRTETIKVTSK